MDLSFSFSTWGCWTKGSCSPSVAFDPVSPKPLSSSGRISVIDGSTTGFQTVSMTYDQFSSEEFKWLLLLLSSEANVIFSFSSLEWSLVWKVKSQALLLIRLQQVSESRRNVDILPLGRFTGKQGAIGIRWLGRIGGIGISRLLRTAILIDGTNGSLVSVLLLDGLGMGWLLIRDMLMGASSDWEISSKICWIVFFWGVEATNLRRTWFLERNVSESTRRIFWGQRIVGTPYHHGSKTSFSRYSSELNLDLQMDRWSNRLWSFWTHSRGYCQLSKQQVKISHYIKKYQSVYLIFLSNPSKMIRRRERKDINCQNLEIICLKFWILRG